MWNPEVKKKTLQIQYRKDKTGFSEYFFCFLTVYSQAAAVSCRCTPLTSLGLHCPHHLRSPSSDPALIASLPSTCTLLPSNPSYTKLRKNPLQPRSAPGTTPRSLAFRGSPPPDLRRPIVPWAWHSRSSVLAQHSFLKPKHSFFFFLFLFFPTSLALLWLLPSLAP